MRAIFDFRSTLPTADMTGVTAAANKTKGSRTTRFNLKGGKLAYSSGALNPKRTAIHAATTITTIAKTTDPRPVSSPSSRIPPLPMLSVPEGTSIQKLERLLVPLRRKDSSTLNCPRPSSCARPDKSLLEVNQQARCSPRLEGHNVSHSAISRIPYI